MAYAFDEVGDAMTGRETDSGARWELMRLAKKLTPFSTLGCSRLAHDRLIYENLQRMLDPEA